jgi:formate dehydrogenase maturation protein FdhE
VTFKTRLKALEQHASAEGRRCANCRDWQATYLTYENDWREASGMRLLEHKEHPGTCPRCGFEPMNVVIAYVEDWRDGPGQSEGQA